MTEITAFYPLGSSIPAILIVLVSLPEVYHCVYIMWTLFQTADQVRLVLRKMSESCVAMLFVVRLACTLR